MRSRRNRRGIPFDGDRKLQERLQSRCSSPFRPAAAKSFGTTPLLRNRLWMNKHVTCVNFNYPHATFLEFFDRDKPLAQAHPRASICLPALPVIKVVICVRSQCFDAELALSDATLDRSVCCAKIDR